MAKSGLLRMSAKRRNIGLGGSAVPLEYRLDTPDGIVRAQVTGSVTEREVTDAVDRIIRATAGIALHRNAITILADSASLDLIGIDALRRIHAHLKAWMKAFPDGNVKSAFVTSNSPNASVLRVWKALAEIDPNIGRHVRIFSDENAANAWISTP